MRSSKTILITGGAGFIGVNAARRFAKEGWQVTVFDNFARKGSELNFSLLQKDFPEVKLIRGDVRSMEDLTKALAEPFNVVLHLAAQVAVTTSVVKPREDFEINALGTFNLLEAVRNCPRPPIVLYASTNKVYGGLESVGVVEQDKRYAFASLAKGVSEEQGLDFHSPYGCSKGGADQYVRDYSRIYGLKTVVFRQSCIYGQHQMGIEDQGWVAWFLIAGMFGRPVTLYGNGKQVRDLLHVDDLTELYVQAVNNIDTLSGHAYNVGGGMQNTLSLLEFLEILKTDLGLELSIGHASERPGDQPIFVSDNTAVSKAANWTPKVPVRDGIRRLHAWLQDHKEELSQFYRQ